MTLVKKCEIAEEADYEFLWGNKMSRDLLWASLNTIIVLSYLGRSYGVQLLDEKVAL